VAVGAALSGEEQEQTVLARLPRVGEIVLQIEEALLEPVRVLDHGDHAVVEVVVGLAGSGKKGQRGNNQQGFGIESAHRRGPPFAAAVSMETGLQAGYRHRRAIRIIAV
jgi:hypothetical protein